MDRRGVYGWEVEGWEIEGWDNREIGGCGEWDGSDNGRGKGRADVENRVLMQ